MQNTSKQLLRGCIFLWALVEDIRTSALELIALEDVDHATKRAERKARS